jgi:hypothetical protein
MIKRAIPGVFSCPVCFYVLALLKNKQVLIQWKKFYSIHYMPTKKGRADLPVEELALFKHPHKQGPQYMFSKLKE